MHDDPNYQYKAFDLPSEVFNAGNGSIVNYNGQAVKVAHNDNGTRNLSNLGTWDSYQNQQAADAATAKYQQGVDTAVGGLTQRQNDLPGQYADLLKTVKGQYDPLVNQTTQTAGAELSRRGLTPDSTLFQQQTQGALQPVYGAEAANAQQIGQGSISDINTLAANIAAMKAGEAGTASTFPLQYGSLSLQQQMLPSQIALAQANARQANAGANYISVPNVGVYDLAAKQFVGGAGGASSGALTGVGGLFTQIK